MVSVSADSWTVSYNISLANDDDIHESRYYSLQACLTQAHVLIDQPSVLRGQLLIANQANRCVYEMKNNNAIHVQIMTMKLYFLQPLCNYTRVRINASTMLPSQITNCSLGILNMLIVHLPRHLPRSIQPQCLEFTAMFKDA